MDHRDSHVIVIRQFTVALNPLEDVLDISATEIRTMAIEFSGCTFVVLVAIKYLQIARAVSFQRADRLVVDREGLRILYGYKSF